MKIRTRILIIFTGIFLLFFGYLAQWSIKQIRPNFFKAMEETLVDMSALLAEQLANEFDSTSLDLQQFQETFARAEKRSIEGSIFDFQKEYMDIRIYCTDTNGIVIFDSDNGNHVGEDYSQWNDVHLTLQGRYGARFSIDDKYDEGSPMLYVASPVLRNDTLIAVVSVGKSAHSINPFVLRAKKKIFIGIFFLGVSILVLGLVLTQWITKPIRSLTEYACAIRDGKSSHLPKLGKTDIGTMGQAFAQMHEALEDKKYVEQYVQTLTHELKTPIGSICASADLLLENPNPEAQLRSIINIRKAGENINELVQGMLVLSTVESRRNLKDLQKVEVTQILKNIIDTVEPSIINRRLKLVKKYSDSCTILGDEKLIRTALTNVVQNAVDFTPPQGSITISWKKTQTHVILTIDNSGVTIPQHALTRIFERFYSLDRPGTLRHSTGLGLSFTQKAIELHQGTVTVENLNQIV